MASHCILCLLGLGQPFLLVFSHLSVALLFIFRPYDSKNPFLATVTLNRRLNKGGDRHLMHLEVDITGSRIRWIYVTCFFLKPYKHYMTR